MLQADRAGLLPPSDTTGSVPLREGRVSDVVRCESVPNSRICCRSLAGFRRMCGDSGRAHFVWLSAREGRRCCGHAQLTDIDR